MKRKILTIYVLALISALLIIGMVSAVNNSCTKDSDCTKVNADCCGCTAGGKQIAINKDSKNSYEANLTPSCAAVSCIQVMSDDPSCSQKASCINNVCSLADEILVGNDSDAHGCKASAGYQWCEAKNKCLRIWEENCTDKCDYSSKNKIYMYKNISTCVVVDYACVEGKPFTDNCGCGCETNKTCDISNLTKCDRSCAKDSDCAPNGGCGACINKDVYITNPTGIALSCSGDSYGLECKCENNLCTGKPGEGKTKILPETASLRARERLGELGFNVSLKEVGQNKTVYFAEAEKQGKFFGIFKVQAKVSAEIDAETGEVIKVHKPWWGFMAGI